MPDPPRQHCLVELSHRNLLFLSTPHPDPALSPDAPVTSLSLLLPSPPHRRPHPPSSISAFAPDGSDPAAHKPLPPSTLPPAPPPSRSTAPDRLLPAPPALLPAFADSFLIDWPYG